MVQRLPLETQTLYAELLEHLLGVEASRSTGHLPGTFTRKQVKSETYVYYQASVPGGKTRQFYLGRNSPVLDRLASRFERDRAALSEDKARTRRLAAQLRAGGAAASDTPSARVIAGLAEAGLFSAGGVLVGTHAFVVLGNLLGVHWGNGALRTQDVDFGADERDIDVAVSDEPVDVPAAIESLEMGFLPVPPLDPKSPATSFKVRGQALRVDLLCPKRGDSETPVFIKRWNAAAHPLEFLDYLLEAPEKGVLLGGDGTLVNLPAPARFALHKLVIAPRRPAAFASKSRKDITQAIAVLEVLLSDRPGDLPIAMAAFERRGDRHKKALDKALAALKKEQPDLAKRVKSIM
jgi:hypothetical protein